MLAYREAVAAWYGRRFGVTLDPATEVIALIGSKEGNHHLALGLLDPGDVAIVPDPGYPAYLSSVIFAGGEVARVRLRPEQGFLVDFGAIPDDVAERTKILWLSYPNNPTTAVATVEFYDRAVAFARRRGIVLVNDNPYSEVSYDGVRIPSILEADGAMDLAVEFNSLSKPYNMTGWRIGMAVGNAAIIDAIDQVKENTDSGIFNAIQLAGIAALEGPQDVVEEMRRTYQARRDAATALLTEHGIGHLRPRGAFYLWIDVRDRCGRDVAAWALDLLRREGVAVAPGTAFGPAGEGWIRTSLATATDDLLEGVRRIARA
jgi:LL-diaminopimelate aminotransferase